MTFNSQALQKKSIDKQSFFLIWLVSEKNFSLSSQIPRRYTREKSIKKVSQLLIHHRHHSVRSPRPHNLVSIPSSVQFTSQFIEVYSNTCILVLFLVRSRVCILCLEFVFVFPFFWIIFCVVFFLNLVVHCFWTAVRILVFFLFHQSQTALGTYQRKHAAENQTYRAKLI